MKSKEKSKSSLKNPLKQVKTYPIDKRKNKVKKEDFALCPKPKKSFRDFYKGLPDFLGAADLRSLVKAIITARRKNKSVIFMMGAHVIKCGLNPVFIELLKKDIITAVAFNGAGCIHDFEVALIGQTSEDVAQSIEDGSFGMARETGSLINKAIIAGVAKEEGIGGTIGRMIGDKKMPHRQLSLLYQAKKLNIPVTVHVAIGTDIIHQHPSCSGAAVGEGSMLDFQKFIDQVRGLNNGGVIVNIGSAVILPEVFLKALTVARNISSGVKNFTTANFDMILHYRPHENVLHRPILSGGRSYNFIGQHEIMIPLLGQAIIEQI